jgi:excisionase family DNA binding protein
MSNPDKLLRIKQVADMLGVSTRTVYRRIWAEELPAVKIGGLYYVRQADLEQSIASVPSSAEVVSPKIVKCGACLKILRDPEKIARRCAHAGCFEVICSECAAQGKSHCRAHQSQTEPIFLRRQPDKQGPIKIRASQARLRELNYLNRIRARIRQIESLAHPRTGTLISIPDWEAILKTGDERAEVLRLKGKILLDARESVEQPLNAWLRYHYKPTKGEQTDPLIIEIRVLNRLDVMVSDGQDTYPLDEEDLEEALIHATESLPPDGSFKLFVAASPTGWKKEAQEIILGSQTQARFAHENLLVYLFDMQTNDLIFPLKDIRSVQYAELFNPALLTEDAQDAEVEIENMMLEKGHTSLTLLNAVKELPFSEMVLKETFKQMAKKGNYRLVELEDIGLAIQRI